MIYSFHGSSLFFQTDSNKLELKMSSRISEESLVVSDKGQSLALFFLWTVFLSAGTLKCMTEILIFLIRSGEVAVGVVQ